MSRTLKFHGAAGTVTGSCFLLESGKARVLIDCGMFQGSKTLKQLNYGAFPFDPRSLDAVLVTHAHIDHSGLLPKLTLAGYAGPIFATRATVALLGCLLPDSGHIQESEVEFLNRRNRQRGRPTVEPIYTVVDAEDCLKQLSRVAYAAWVDVADGVRARWWNAGHLLGSASIEIEIAEDGAKPTRLLFSGDIGPDHKLLQPDPVAPTGFDYVVVESTYGNRDRPDVTDAARRNVLIREVTEAHRAGGALLIPSFAVERTQEIVADLIYLMDENIIPSAPVFVDSPLASKATEVFRTFAGELQNGEALLKALSSSHLHVTESVAESKALARFSGFHVIISASGMCDAGRIRHHLKNWLPEPQATVLLVGFQAQGSLGRILQDGANAVRIQGDEISVKARIRAIEDYSGHADGSELLAWIRQRLPISRHLFLVHGEDEAIAGLKAAITTQAILPENHVVVPRMDDSFALAGDGAALVPNKTKRRIEPAAVSRLDWHNDVSKLLLDISSAIAEVPDERARQVVIRRLRRALEPDH
jgi:metallo-beta-lactamase family protein